MAVLYILGNVTALLNLAGYTSHTLVATMLYMGCVANPVIYILTIRILRKQALGLCICSHGSSSVQVMVWIVFSLFATFKSLSDHLAEATKASGKFEETRNTTKHDIAKTMMRYRPHSSLRLSPK